MTTMTHGHMQKLSRAHEHLQRLRSEVERWFAEGNVAFTHEPQPSGPPDYQTRVQLIKLPNDVFGLIIGDFLQNLRASLDHIAYALADAETTRRGQPKDFVHNSEFPIVGNESRRGHPICGATEYPRISAAKLACIHPDAEKHIQAVQPFHRGGAFREHPLWRLHELCVIDKHRLIHAVVYAFKGMAIRVGHQKNVPIVPPMRVHGGPIENDSIVMTYRLSVPESEADLDLSPVIGIAVSNGTCADGLNVLELLPEIHSFVAHNVLTPLERYL